jgi:manganese transport protein
MPHNLYLHSSICKIRAKECFQLPDDNDEETPLLPEAPSMSPVPSRESSSGLPLPITINTPTNLSVPATITPTLSVPDIIHLSLIDTIIALTFAVVINASILIVSSSNFYPSPVAELSDAFTLLSSKLGVWAGTLFAVALLMAGQSSTITGTLAGQIVMEGFMTWRPAPWLRRLITRGLAIVPAVFVIVYYGDAGLNRLLVGSQVVLSLQLPFAVWPLVYFTSRKDVMDKDRGDGDGMRRNGVIVNVLSLMTAVAVTVFNLVLIVQVWMDGEI